MRKKHPLKLFPTGTLVALGLTIHSLDSKALEAKDHKPQPKKAEQTEKKMTEGMCGSSMRMDMEGMVMHENKDKLPKGCAEVSEDITLKVSAGTKYAEKYPGTVFGFDAHQWEVKPCSRVTIEFTNDDEIRHQWMIHGLPRYLYPQSMFHIEVNGKGKKTGTFIVPRSDFTFLVHCDIAQHMEKGMKAQLKVGNGRKDLPSIPGISDPTFPDHFPNQEMSKD